MGPKSLWPKNDSITFSRLQMSHDRHFSLGGGGPGGGGGVLRWLSAVLMSG